jgi:CMP-N-acetylneuraminic acid synthetase
MEICAIIPARGGSKGIKKKNLTSIGGRPLIMRTIEVARKSEYINRIIVSTDDKEILEVAQTNGSEVIKRPPEISGDDATSESAILDVLDKLKKQENYCPDITIFLQCTSPFTIPEDIDGTINTLINKNADSALAVTEFHHFLWKYDENLKTAIGINHNEKYPRERRQDIAPQYLEAGSVYVMKTKGFLKHKNRFFGNISIYEVPQMRSFEIDSPFELKIANKIERLMNSSIKYRTLFP